MKMLKKNEGFTLIELMIVVVIIGVLAAVAVPQFLKYQLKAKSSESTRMVGAMKTATESFFNKYPCTGSTIAGCYVQATESSNAAGTAPLLGQKTDFVASAGLTLIGFTTSGLVYFVYGIGPAAALPAAPGDLATGGDCTAQGVPGSVNGVTNSSIALNAQGVPEVIDGVLPTAPASNVITWSARGDVDGASGDVCYLMQNLANEFVPIPIDASDNAF